MHLLNELLDLFDAIFDPDLAIEGWKPAFIKLWLEFDGYKTIAKMDDAQIDRLTDIRQRMLMLTGGNFEEPTDFV